MIGSFCEAHGIVNCSVCGYKGLVIGCNMALGDCRCNQYKLTKEELEKLRFPKVDDFLKSINVEKIDIGLYISKWFEYIPEEELYKSKKKHLGASTGDDKNLYIHIDDKSTLIWWKDNKGFEDTIFCGKSLKTVKEIETVFELLELKIYKITV